MTPAVEDTIRKAKRTVLCPDPDDGVGYWIEAEYGIRDNRFFVTADVWYPDEDGDRRKEPDSSGQNHALVLEAFPWLSQLVAVHLHDALSGEPIHAADNAWYWFVDGSRQAEHYLDWPDGTAHGDRAARAASYLGVGPELFRSVVTKGHKDRFYEIVESLKPAWRQRAAAIRAIYELGGPVE